jgi:hypothetical protein
MKVMVVLNKTASSQNVDLTRFAELLIKGTTAKNIITDEKITLNKQDPCCRFETAFNIGDRIKERQ